MQVEGLTVRAMAIEEFGAAETLKPMALPRPRPERGEILVRVVAAGVNPVDCGIRSGRLAEVFPHAFPLIPGWDVAGVVEELGEGASRFRKGDRVWGHAGKPTVQWGCYADYVTLPERHAAIMPTKLLFEEAAAVPVAALTAQQALFSKGRLASGGSVLVQAAAGGVGHFAVQLARDCGAKAYGTARAANHEFVLGLGARAAIDYTGEDVVEAVRRHEPDGVDLVLDAIGGEAQARSLDALRPGGRLVTLVTPPDPDETRARGIVAELMTVEPDGEQLSLLARLVDHGRLRPHVQKIYPLGEAAQAHRAVEDGHVRGKLVLNI
jgi:NADPH2:quinone reductase